MNLDKSGKGFTLIEVLIALLILTVGLLGMATLMMSSLQSSQGAYLRSQASVQAYDLIERMRANSSQAITTNNYTLAADATATADPECGTSDDGCTPSDQAQQDLHDWRAALEAGIPGATAVIARQNGNEYTITIEWAEHASADADNDPDTPNTPVKSTFVLRVNL